MKKPFYVTIRKKKDGRQRVCIVFNNTTTGERGRVVSASSLYKAYFKGQAEKLLEMPTGGHWSSKLINTLSLWALSTGFVSFDKAKGPEITLKEYATKFWTYEQSDYVARKNAEKEGSIHRSYVKDMLCVLNKHILPRLPEGRLLSDVQPSDAERIKDAMLKEGISSSMINKAMSCIRLILEEAYRLGYISEDKASRIINVHRKEKKRGILSTDETSKLLSWLEKNTKGYDRYKYLTVRLAIETGCREGEIVALTPSCFSKMDNGNYSVLIKASMSERDGIKSTKNGECRYVTASSGLGGEILDYASRNPYFNKDGYIFYSKENPEKPLLKKKIREDAFYWGLYSIGIDEEERKARNIVFHSERHFSAVKLSQHGDKRQIKLSTGHKSDAVFNVYTGHQTEEDIVALDKAREKAFCDIF